MGYPKTAGFDTSGKFGRKPTIFGNRHFQLRKKDPEGKNHKVVIFSQFTAVLDLIQSVSWLSSFGLKLSLVRFSLVTLVN